MRIVARSHRVLPALAVAGICVLTAPQAHAGFLDKIKKKVDKVTEKVSNPVNEANAKVNQSVGEAMRPMTDAQRKLNETTNRVTAPVTQMKNGVGQIQQAPNALEAAAQAQLQTAKSQAMSPVTAIRPLTKAPQNIVAGVNPMAALRSKLMGAARLTDTTYGRDAILSRFKLDALAAGDGKSLRLTGTVATAAQKLRAQQLAQRNFKTVINEIRVAPAAAKTSLKLLSAKKSVR